MKDILDLASIILFFMILWGMIFGFTIDGVHYDYDCSYDRGVEFSAKEVDSNKKVTKENNKNHDSR